MSAADPGLRRYGPPIALPAQTDATDPADRLYRVNDDPDTDTTLGALIAANEGAPLPPRDMARLRALATGERLVVAIPHGPRLTFERRA